MTLLISVQLFVRIPFTRTERLFMMQFRHSLIHSIPTLGRQGALKYYRESIAREQVQNIAMLYPKHGIPKREQLMVFLIKTKSASISVYKLTDIFDPNTGYDSIRIQSIVKRNLKMVAAWNFSHNRPKRLQKLESWGFTIKTWRINPEHKILFLTLLQE